MNPSDWRGRSVFVTGHTGFKGSWLCLWLDRWGARVTGYALAPPTTPSLFECARVGERVESVIADVRDLSALSAAMAAARPEVIVHLAAQPLVRRSYREPVETFETNVLGTVNLLEAARQVESVRAVVVVTTDKCYQNREWVWGYRECDPLGGDDPYSASKGCAELAAAGYRRSFFAGPEAAGIATARAGNVIGGGDWALDRLVPDILTGVARGEPVRIRHPHAIRPWQHVVEPLYGYLLLAEALLRRTPGADGGWNFGPPDEEARPVGWIADRLTQAWGNGAHWERDGGDHPHEATYLKLDASKARQVLGWRPRLDLAAALDWTVAWFRGFHEGADAFELTRRDLDQYEQRLSLHEPSA